MNIPLRRKDRLMDEVDVKDLLARGKYGVLSTISEDNTAYANPISYVYHKGNIYFHSSNKGHKVDNMAHNPNVAFVVVGDVNLFVENKMDSYFESVIAFGRADLLMPGEDDDEILEGLTELMRKYMPTKVDGVPNDVKTLGKVTNVYRLTIDHVTGKAKKRV